LDLLKYLGEQEMAIKKGSIGSTGKTCVKSKTGRRAVWRTTWCLEESMY